MTEEDIANALGQRLVAALPLYEVVFEGRDGLPNRPYVAAEVVRVKTFDDTLAGGFRHSVGFFQATAVIEAGIFASPALHIAEQIAEGFPYGTRITIPGGVITIKQPPAIQQGIRDGMDYRVPVRIDYEAEEQ